MKCAKPQLNPKIWPIFLQQGKENDRLGKIAKKKYSAGRKCILSIGGCGGGGEKGRVEGVGKNPNCR